MTLKLLTAGKAEFTFNIAAGRDAQLHWHLTNICRQDMIRLSGKLLNFCLISVIKIQVKSKE